MKDSKVVLVTGGCGYIGSHVSALLSESGYQVLVLDDLSTGHKSALLNNEPLFVGCCGDRKLLSEITHAYDVSAVMHFAGSIVVPESIQKPLEYYRNNVANTLSLLEHVKEAGIPHFILSSSAAVYGDGDGDGEDLSETVLPRPIHPYGRSKLVDEWMLADIAAVSSLSFVALRYFNVAGADSDLRIGQSSRLSTHLIKIACEVAVGKRDQLAVYGDDYQTSDGTCVRDYVHVLDLAQAHLCGLRYLERGGQSQTLNCGYNRGYSVREVIASFEKIIQRPITKKTAERRPGDVAKLVARAEKIREVLDWNPRHDNLEQIIESSLSWEKVLASKNAL